MEVEFHYYVTYLIAAKAGFQQKDALTIAYASQYVDDNDVVLEVDKDSPDTSYNNYISQTLNILKPKPELYRIYPIFHFIPGDPLFEGACRKDGCMHWLNTTPNSENANKIVDAALDTGDLYRIGIAMHGYADTWAHQNFVGYYSAHNGMGELLPNIGHADAKHDPDLPGLIWLDPRLKHGIVDNTKRFLDAAQNMLAKLLSLTKPGMSEEDVASLQNSLRDDLAGAIGGPDYGNAKKGQRIKNYINLSCNEEYGGLPLAKYDEDEWISGAIDETVNGLSDRRSEMVSNFVLFKDDYRWKYPAGYKDTPWYRFQEAVKEHQAFAIDLLKQTNLSRMELPAENW